MATSTDDSLPADDLLTGVSQQSWLGRTFSALSDSNFRLLYAGNVLQFGSQQMQMLVRGVLVFQLTGSFAALGTIALANAIPGLISAPIGGVLADRAPKKLVIQAAQMYNVVNAAALAILAAGFLGLRLEFWHLFLSAVVQGGVNSAMQPARQSIIGDIVGRERLMNAIAINSSGQNLMQLIGPALGGVLIAVISPSAVFWTMAGMYALAVTFTVRLPKHPLHEPASNHAAASAASAARPRRHRSTMLLDDLGDGMKYVARERIIRTVIVVNFLIVVVAMPYTMLLPGFVSEVLHKGALEQGLMVSLSGVGAVVGSLMVASGVARGRGRKLLACGAVLGISLVAFAISTNYWVTLPIMLFIGAGQAVRMSMGQVLLQSYSAAEYRGRVMAVWMMQFSLVQFGTFFVGLLAEFVGPQWAIGGLAGTMVLCMAYFAAFVPTIRDLQ